MKTNFDFKLMLPRLCFAAEIDKYRKEHRVLNYNGLIVLEANNLADYDERCTSAPDDDGFPRGQRKEREDRMPGCWRNYRLATARPH